MRLYGYVFLLLLQQCLCDTLEEQLAKLSKKMKKMDKEVSKDKGKNNDFSLFKDKVKVTHNDKKILKFKSKRSLDEVIDTDSKMDEEGNIMTCYEKADQQQMQNEITKLNLAIFNRKRREVSDAGECGSGSIDGSGCIPLIEESDNKICEKTGKASNDDVETKALEKLNDANWPKDEYGSNTMVDSTRQVFSNQSWNEIFIMNKLSFMSHWDIVDSDSFVLINPQTYDKYTDVQDKIEKRVRENGEKVDLIRLSVQLNTIRPTLQYAYHKSLTIVLRENAQLTGGLAKLLENDLNYETQDIEKQTELFKTIKAQPTNFVGKQTKTIDLISEIQLEYEDVLLDIRKFMLNLISVSYRIFHLTHRNMKKNLAHQDSPISVQLVIRNSLKRMIKQSETIVDGIKKEIDTVLDSMDKKLLQKTKSALMVVKDETTSNIKARNEHVDVQQNIRDKTRSLNGKISRQQDDVDKVKQEIDEAHAELNRFLQEKKQKRTLMKADVKENRDLIESKRLKMVARYDSYGRKINRQEEFIGDTLRKKFMANSYTCIGPRWFLDKCVAAREQENLSIRQQWEYMMAKLHKRTERFERKQDALEADFKNFAYKISAKNDVLEDEFKQWRIVEERKARQTFYQKNQELKAKQLKVLNLRKSMLTAEMELEIMHKTGDFKTKQLDDTTAALNAVRNSFSIVYQELSNLRAYLEDFPARLQNSKFKLQNDAYDYNELVDLQNSGTAAAEIEKYQRNNFFLELENMYNRMISWVLLARQSFSTFRIIGELDGYSRTTDLDELFTRFRQMKKVTARNLDDQIAEKTRELLFEDQIRHSLPEHFDFDVDNVKTGKNILCESNESSSNKIERSILEEQKEFIEPICRT